MCDFVCVVCVCLIGSDIQNKRGKMEEYMSGYLPTEWIEHKHVSN